MTMRARQVEHHEARPVWRAGLLAGAVVLAACGPDPAGKYQEFIDDTRESSTGMTEPTGPGTSEPATTEPGTSTGDTPVEVFDISGDFLLAVSTVVDPVKPLQFIATNTVTMDADGGQVLDVCLQPLTLMQGKVTVPREPIGEPLCFKGVVIVYGGFVIDAGTVAVTGMANPITQSDIVASLVMTGKVEDADFYCGTVNGEVMEPPLGSIEGSNFAAVRLADKTMLPTDVTYNCDRATVTDS